MVSFNRKLHADYFGAKIRKIQPVTKPVEGFKVKVQGRVSLSNLYLANSAIHYLDSVDLCEAMIAFVPVH